MTNNTSSKFTLEKFGVPLNNHTPIIMPHTCYRFRFLNLNREENVLSLNLVRANIDFANCIISMEFRVDVSGIFLQTAINQFSQGKKFILETLANNDSVVETMLIEIDTVLVSEINLDYSKSETTKFPVKLKYKSLKFMLVNNE